MTTGLKEDPLRHNQASEKGTILGGENWKIYKHVSLPFVVVSGGEGYENRQATKKNGRQEEEMSALGKMGRQ